MTGYELLSLVIAGVAAIFAFIQARDAAGSARRAEASSGKRLADRQRLADVITKGQDILQEILAAKSKGQEDLSHWESTRDIWVREADGVLREVDATRLPDFHDPLPANDAESSVKERVRRLMNILHDL